MATTSTKILRSGLSRGLRIPAAAAPAMRVGSCSDEKLVAAIAAGEGAALGELYDRFGRAVYGLALRIVRDPRLAEDVVQEAFLSVWRAAGSFDVRRGSARSWLLMLAHRRAVDLIRCNQRDRVRDNRKAAHTPSQSEPSASATAELDAERRAVQIALASLATTDRSVLELAYYGGCTQREIAARLGLPIGTVKSRTSHALRQLGELLAAA